MNVKAALSSYEKLSFSITLTAPVEDWRAMVRLLEKLNKASGNFAFAWPVGGFIGAVQKMLSDLDKTHADVLLKEDQAAFTSANETKGKFP